MLRCLRRKDAIAPPNQSIYSLQALEYLEMLELKIARGMKNMQFEETYDEWSRLLKESGLVHPLWNQEYCEFVKNTLSFKPTTVELFQEIVSFKRQGRRFTYQLLGFSHSEIDEVFDWSWVSDKYPWVRFPANHAGNETTSYLTSNSKDERKAIFRSYGENGPQTATR